MDIDAGSLVISIAGRDKGGLFVVMEVDGGYCCIADGKIRKADRPKKKKLKHVKLTGEKVSAIREKLESGQRPTNSEIRKVIREYRERNSEENVEKEVVS